MTQPLPPITCTSDEFEGDISTMELNPLFKGMITINILLFLV